MDTPDIALAKDLYGWVAAAVEAWIAAEPGRSQRQFALFADVPRGTVNNVLRKARPLPPEHVDALATALDLDPAERDILADLVVCAHADASEDDRKRLLGRQALLLAHRPSTQDSAYLANHTTVRVRELAAVPGFRPDPAWIAARLVPPVSEAEVAESLEVLRAFHPRISGSTDSVSSGLEPRWSPSPEYQRQVLVAAQHAVDLPRDQRYLQSWVEAVPEELIPELKRELDALMQRVVAVCRSSTAPTTRLVQVSAQLVPLSVDPGPEGDG